MRRSLEVGQARSIVLPRAALLERGHTEDGIRRAVHEGRFVRLRRGWYVGGEIWRSLWPEARHLLHVVAVHADARSERPVFCGVSAAVLHGLPLYRTSPARVHIAAMRGTSRSVRDVLRHETDLDDEDVVEVEGLRCTTLGRTVFDVARTLTPEASVACADAALRSVAVSGNDQDERTAAQWRGSLAERAARSRARGVRQARRVIDFADGRAQLPGESVSRVQLTRLGFGPPDLQVRVVAPDGAEYRVDFGLDDVDAFGEFDGAGKYLDPALRGGRSIEQVVLDEKRREDVIRGVTGRRFVRWDDAHISTADALRRRLAEFGLHPPRR